MAYTLKICFKLSGTARFTGDDARHEFTMRDSGKSFELVALDGKKTMESSRHFILSGKSFETEDEAQNLARALRLAILMWGIRNNVGVNLAQLSIPDLILVDHDSNQLYSPVFDRLGITIFDDGAACYPSLFAKGVAPQSTEAFIESIADSYNNLNSFPKTYPETELAMELYAASHFESNIRTRFLTLITSLESLIARNRKKRSISETGQKMAKELLKNNKYGSMDPDKFFKKLYDIRCGLVHEGALDRKAWKALNVLVGDTEETGDRAKFHVLIGKVDRFVSDILQCHLVELITNDTSVTQYP